MIFSKPLILGASVSADHSTLSPGKILCMRHCSTADIRTIAQNGMRGRAIVKRVTSKFVEDRTIIIGLDLFFWDSFDQSPEESIRALYELLELAKRYEVPLVIGNIPGLMPSHQPSRVGINCEIKAAQLKYSGLSVLDLDQIHREVVLTGGVEYQGKRYGFWELVPDGLHIGEVGAAVLEKKIESLVAS